MTAFRVSAGADDWSALDRENVTEYLEHLGQSPLAERSVTDTLAWISTGIDDNTYNGVAWARLDDASADAVIAATLQTIRDRSMPALWYIGDGSRPADLAQRLAVQGCHELGAGVGMAGDLTTLKLAQTLLPGLTIHPVRDSGDLALWCAVYDESGEGRREALYASLGLDGEQPLRHFLARLDGIPVATASIFLASRAAGLYHVEVAPHVRRRGIGTAVVQAALTEARNAGYRMAVLGPTYESQGMYARMGFQLYENRYRCFAI